MHRMLRNYINLQKNGKQIKLINKASNLKLNNLIKN